MKPKITLLIVLTVFLLLGCAETYLNYEDHIRALNSYQSSITKGLSINFENLFSTLSSFRLTPYSSSLTKRIKAIALIDLRGNVISSYGDLGSRASYKYSDLYKFVSLKGKYISLLSEKGGFPLITIASLTKDGNHIAIAKISPFKLKESGDFKAFLVDDTGLGVSLMGTPVWHNFSALIAHKTLHPFVKNGIIVNVKKVNFGGYSLVLEKPFFPLLFSILKIQLVYFFVLYAISLTFYGLFHRIYGKKINSLFEFSRFIRELDNFKRYELTGEEINPTVERYNMLVDKAEKRSREYSNLVEELSEMNSELTEVSHLLVEFSMLFNDVRAKRKDLKNALKIAFRRMLDFSRTINGLGMKYRDIAIYLGTINEFNFDRSLDSTMSVDLKTDSEKVKFVVKFDKFTMNDRLREMIKMLFHYLTSFISMHELVEKSDLSKRYDSLTGLFTRQEFEELAIREIARAKRENDFISLIMMDVKNLKGFNDKHGQLEGDTLLKFIAKAITVNSRITDIACRFGEDEFILCLVGMKKSDAEKKWTSIISKIMTFKYDVEIKYAIASYPSDGENIESLMAQLDKRIEEYGNS